MMIFDLVLSLFAVVIGVLIGVNGDLGSVGAGVDGGGVDNGYCC